MSNALSSIAIPSRGRVNFLPSRCPTGSRTSPSWVCTWPACRCCSCPTSASASGAGPARRHLLPQNVRHHGRLPPLLRPPRLQDLAGDAIRPRLAGVQRHATRAVVVGAHHRIHHRYSDTPLDPHSPHETTFWWAHVGWVTTEDAVQAPWESIQDFQRFPELRWLDRFHWVPGIVLAAACYAIGAVAGGWNGSWGTLAFLGAGWSCLLWGWLISTVLTYHATFSINSLSHLWGKRRYATSDDSRNNAVLALITLGEGWHNNHHHFQSSANQGFFCRWEFDVSYMVIRRLEFAGLVWGVRTPGAKAGGRWTDRTRPDACPDRPRSLSPTAAPAAFRPYPPIEHEPPAVTYTPASTALLTVQRSDHGFDPADPSGPAADGRLALLGLQQELGLRPQRHPGAVAGDRAGARDRRLPPPRLLTDESSGPALSGSAAGAEPVGTRTLGRKVAPIHGGSEARTGPPARRVTGQTVRDEELPV